MVRIDEQRLLALLEQNSREKAVVLAKKLGVTETAVRKKIEKLVADGVIEQFTIRTNPAKLNEKEVHIGVDTEPEAYLTTLRALKKERVVRQLYTASGDHMLLAICRFPSQERAAAYIKHLTKRPGVTKVCPAFINEQVK